MNRIKPKLAHKHYRLDQSKISRVKKLLGARTETETIEKALDEVIQERERNRRAWSAHGRFLRSGMIIDDAFGSLKG